MEDRGLGWGVRVVGFQGMALFVESTFEGCIYLVLNCANGATLAHGHAENIEVGKLSAIRTIFKPGCAPDATEVAYSLEWEEYPL